jgi:hypothetical protein
LPSRLIEGIQETQPSPDFFQKESNAADAAANNELKQNDSGNRINVRKKEGGCEHEDFLFANEPTPMRVHPQLPNLNAIIACLPLDKVRNSKERTLKFNTGKDE